MTAVKAKNIPTLFRFMVLLVLSAVWVLIINSHSFLLDFHCGYYVENTRAESSSYVVQSPSAHHWPMVSTTTSNEPQELSHQQQQQQEHSRQRYNFSNPLQTSPYAYMFIVGGINPEKPSYRGFVFNVMVSTYLLKQHGSTADVVCFLQMSVHTNATALPAKEEDALRRLGVQLRYMEKPQHESFADINMEKFRILTLTEYRRVIFMDADVVPVINMDYLMELSDGPRPLLQPNFVVAAGREPSNGGLFMMTPGPGDYEALLKVIDNQRESAKHLKFPFFDREVGWGHSFKEHGDQWDGLEVSLDTWQFFGAHVDQGLLYYWTKYHQQNVTIFKGNIVENWVAGGAEHNYQPYLQASFHPSLVYQYSPKNHYATIYRCTTHNDWNKHLCKPPYNDYAHFIGDGKPWQRGWSEEKMNSTVNIQLMDAERLWFRTVFEIGKMFGFNITEHNVNELFQMENPLGDRPVLEDMARRQQNWTAAPKPADPATAK
jgi:hypothetical protein